MAEMITVKLLRPLNGAEIGSTAEYSKADAESLEARGLVEVIKTKAEKAAPQNKAEPAAPQNKSAKKKGR